MYNAIVHASKFVPIHLNTFNVYFYYFQMTCRQKFDFFDYDAEKSSKFLEESGLKMEDIREDLLQYVVNLDVNIRRMVALEISASQVG